MSLYLAILSTVPNRGKDSYYYYTRLLKFANHLRNAGFFRTFVTFSSKFRDVLLLNINKFSKLKRLA